MLLFGPQAQLAGARAVTVESSRPRLTAAELLAGLTEAVPALAPSIPASRLAVDHRFADPAEPLDPASELALIGMIGGG